jgi:hypothetical protein
MISRTSVDVVRSSTTANEKSKPDVNSKAETLKSALKRQSVVVEQDLVQPKAPVQRATIKPSFTMPEFPPLPAMPPRWTPVTPALATPTDDEPPEFALSIVAQHVEFWDGAADDVLLYHVYLHLRTLPCIGKNGKQRQARDLTLADAPDVALASVEIFEIFPHGDGARVPEGFALDTAGAYAADSPLSITIADTWKLALPSNRSSLSPEEQKRPIGWLRRCTIPIPATAFGAARRGTRAFRISAKLDLAVELGIGEAVEDWGDLVEVKVCAEKEVTVSQLRSEEQLALPAGFDSEKRRRKEEVKKESGRREQKQKAEMRRMEKAGEIF